MRAKFDQLSKGVLSRALAPLGAVAAQHEISGEVQAADIWFQPAPDREAARARLGVLGRMAETPCLIEPFHATPARHEVLDCMSKQLNLRRLLQREAARQKGAAAPAPAPRLWILSAGRPARVMRALALEPMDGWPSGFWQVPSPLLRVHLVVLRDLPRTRDTLLLRLLGRGKTFRRSVHELHALPSDAWEFEVAIPLLLAFRVEIFQDVREDQMPFADELQAIYDDWEKRVKHTAWAAGERAGWEKGERAGWEKGERAGWEKGERAGREKGERAGRLQTLRHDLITVYGARFGALPAALRAAIEDMEEEATLQQWLAPFATRSPDELAVLVQGR